MKEIEWYFDYLSPFAYLQTFRLGELPGDVEVILRPVLFAALLGHWGTKGPAEVAPKRTVTFRHVHWLAKRMGVPYRLPPALPFNPLRALRLTQSLGAGRHLVDTIFRCIWQDGLLPDDEAGWRGIAAAVGADDAEARVSDPEVKQSLIDSGRRAIELGVFGVPTFVADGRLFWGLDQTDLLLDSLADAAVLDDPELARIDTLPASARRR